jgi:hypothetical protein
MKYLRLASVAALVGAATVSAGPLGPRGDDTCPKGYTASVYYKTIYLESSTSATPIESTVIPSPTPVTVESQTSAEPTVTPSSAPAVVPSQVSAVEQVESSTTSTASVAEISSTEAAQLVALLPTSSAESAAAVETTSAPLIQALVEQTTTQTAAETTTQAAAETTAAPVVQAITQQSTSTTEAVVATTATTASAVVKAAQATSSSSGGNSGEATFYGGNVSGGTCSFSGYSLPSTLFGTALSLERWDSSANCGRCVSVTGPNGNSVKAMVSPFALAPVTSIPHIVRGLTISDR